jgi:hypothetical protein
MPLNPASFPASEPPTAKQLNTALYTYTPGSNFTPTGVLFHANRPLLVEGLQVTLSQASSSSGSTTPLSGSGNWKNYFDNASLFGGGADTAYDTANGWLNPGTPGSDGIPGSAGGHFVIWGFPCFSATTNARGAGSYLIANGTAVSGGKQLSSTTHDNASYVMDIVTTVSGQTTSLTGWCADTSGNPYAYRFNLTDYSGETTRFYGFWCGVVSGGATVSSVPVIPAWNSASTVTSTVLNTSAVGGPMTLLNNPPVLRVGTSLGGSSPGASTLSIVPLGGAQVDTYSAWTSSASFYTVPVSGVYLVHGYVFYSTSTTNNVQAIIFINSATAVYGPAYQAVSGINFGCEVTRLLDLEAGDIIQLATFTNGSNSYGSDLCRIMVTWMAALGTGSTVSFTPPDTGYRWQAGTSGNSLVTAFQQHLANDVSFLIQRPYLLAYQSTAQTGLSQNVFHTITMNTVSGIVHGSAGDPYGGWHTSSGGYYAAPVDGWYLVIAGYAQSSLASGTASCLAGILQTPAGSQSPDYYQHVSTTTTGLNPGAEAIGVYYLRAGDTVQPQYLQQDAGTFSTTVTAGHQSSFGVVWLCE